MTKYWNQIEQRTVTRFHFRQMQKSLFHVGSKHMRSD